MRPRPWDGGPPRARRVLVDRWGSGGAPVGRGGDESPRGAGVVGPGKLATSLGLLLHTLDDSNSGCLDPFVSPLGPR